MHRFKINSDYVFLFMLKLIGISFFITDNKIVSFLNLDTLNQET